MQEAKTYEDGVMAVINALFDASDDYNITVLDELLHDSGIFVSCPHSGETANTLLGEELEECDDDEAELDEEN